MRNSEQIRVPQGRKEKEREGKVLAASKEMHIIGKKYPVGWTSHTDLLARQLHTPVSACREYVNKAQTYAQLLEGIHSGLGSTPGNLYSRLFN